MKRYGQDYYRIRASRDRGRVDPMSRGYGREDGPDARERPGYDMRAGYGFHGGAAWRGFRHMNQEELRAGAPRRIERAAREGYTGYGGYPGPRRSEQWGRYDLGYRRGYDGGW